ncbi:hypothetical protein BDN67DRAFT_970450 [Paxillus ammoniavirescens]|nr:hypothetical protein BDN67DRAFT_970450 [Paxillus ammoniavirescens]
MIAFKIGRGMPSVLRKVGRSRFLRMRTARPRGFHPVSFNPFLVSLLLVLPGHIHRETRAYWVVVPSEIQAR